MTRLFIITDDTTTPITAPIEAPYTRLTPQQWASITETQRATLAQDEECGRSITAQDAENWAIRYEAMLRHDAIFWQGTSETVATRKGSQSRDDKARRQARAQEKRLAAQWFSDFAPFQKPELITDDARAEWRRVIDAKRADFAALNA